MSELLLKSMDAFASLEGTQLLELYTGFVSEFASRLDQIKLMQFLMKVSDQYKGSRKLIYHLKLRF